MIITVLLAFCRSPEITQPSFVLGAIGSFWFLTPLSIHIWSISLLTPDNIELSPTTWKSLMPLSVSWLYRYFTYLGGSFIELTIHAFFILNIAKFKFENITKLDWIFFLAGYYIGQRNILVQTHYIMNTEQTSKNIFT